MTQKTTQNVQTHMHRYTQLHYAGTKNTARQETDSTRILKLFASINTAIADKITNQEYFPKSLHECFQWTLPLKAGYQLSNGIDVVRKVTIIQIQNDKPP